MTPALSFPTRLGIHAFIIDSCFRRNDRLEDELKQSCHPRPDRGYIMIRFFTSFRMTVLINSIVKKLLSLIIIIVLVSCDLFNKEDPDPQDNIYLISANPDQGSYTVPKGDPIEHTVVAENESGRTVLYEFSLNGITVRNGSSDNSYDMPRDDPGDNLLLAIMYSNKNGSQVARDTLATWDYNVEPDAATAIDKYMDMQEEETKLVAKSELENNPDNIASQFSVTSSSSGVSAQFVGDNLEVTGLEDYFGDYEVNFKLTSDGATDYGKVSGDVANTPDNPFADAGDDKTGTINEEITLQGDQSYHPDNPLNEIEEYNWRAINGEENVEITDANQANAIFKALSRGNYDVELTTTDQTGGIDKDTVNVNIDSHLIAGNISELFNEGVNIAGANVAFGDANTATDASGNYSLELALGTGNARLIITHPDFYERQTSSFAPTDTTIDETMVDGDFNMEHYDLITRYADQTLNPGTQRWTTPPTIYIDTSPADNGNGTTTEVTQANIDLALEVIADLPQFAAGLFPNDQVDVEIGTNPPWATEDYIIFRWDNTIPGMGEHFERVNENKIDYAVSRARTTAGKNAYLQELTQNMGARNDSNLETSIFNTSGVFTTYYENDLKIGLLLYTREPGNLAIDKDK